MSMCTLADFRHNAADEIEANLAEFTTLLLRYMHTRHPVLADELCDRFGFRCIAAFDDNVFRYAVVDDITYLIGGGSRRPDASMGTLLDNDREE